MMSSLRPRRSVAQPDRCEDMQQVEQENYAEESRKRRGRPVKPTAMESTKRQKFCDYKATRDVDNVIMGILANCKKQEAVAINSEFVKKTRTPTDSVQHDHNYPGEKRTGTVECSDEIEEIPCFSVTPDQNDLYDSEPETEVVQISTQDEIPSENKENFEDVASTNIQHYKTSPQPLQKASSPRSICMPSIFENYVDTTPYGDSYATVSKFRLDELLKKDVIIDFLTNPKQHEKLQKAGLLLSKPPAAPPLTADKACFVFFVNGKIFNNSKELTKDGMSPWHAMGMRPKSKRVYLECHHGFFSTTSRETEYQLVEYSARLPREKRLRKKVYYIAKDSELCGNGLVIYNYETGGEVPVIFNDYRNRVRLIQSIQQKSPQNNSTQRFGISVSPIESCASSCSPKSNEGRYSPKEDVKPTETVANEVFPMIYYEPEEEKYSELTKGAVFTHHHGENMYPMENDYIIPIYF